MDHQRTYYTFSLGFFSLVIVLLGALLLLGVGVVGVAGLMTIKKEAIRRNTPTPTLTVAPSPPPLASPTPDNGWQTVNSDQLNFSLQIPNSWSTSYRQDNPPPIASQDALPHLVLSSEKGGAGKDRTVNAITIPFPQKIPHGLSSLLIRLSDATLASQSAKKTTIDGLPAVERFTSKKPPPLLSSGDYCYCNTEAFFIDLGTGKVLEVSGTWDHSFPDFQVTFEKIITTLHFTP